MEPRHRRKVRGTPSRVRTVRSARADRCAFCLDPAAQPRPFPKNIFTQGAEMTKASARASDEVPFHFEELFFSRTDGAGIILAGNSVFTRVSGYDWDNMVRKPHKLIRHPDMPRAVFWLLWSTIKRGEPIGAYVKNLAKDGRHYWVFAIVTPIGDHYLSVRLKPSSGLFAAVQKEYEALRDWERREDPAPADSAARLLARLKELGFPDYTSFMSDALAAEVAARNTVLGRSQDRSLSIFSDLLASAKALLTRADVISQAYSRCAYVPLNFQVQAAHLGDAGVSIGEITKNYNDISAEINRSMIRFIASAHDVLGTISTGQFLLGTARIQREVQELFEQELREGRSGEGVEAGEISNLKSVRQQSQKRAAEGLLRIGRQAAQFREDCGEMKRLVAALEVTRVMSKVEVARLDLANSALNELIEDLDDLQKSVGSGLRDIDLLNDAIGGHTSHLLRLEKRAA